jgi:hypothetical protein
MARIRTHRTRTHRTRTLRTIPHIRRRTALAALLHDVPCMVAILASDEDFTAMRRYATFAHTDYRQYLRHIQDVLRFLRSRGLHVRATPFDPGRYTAFCADHGADPDTPLSRARYAADPAEAARAVPYRGERLGDLLRALLEGAGQRTTKERTTAALTAAGTDPAALDRVHGVLTALLRHAGSGSHHLVCSALVDGAPLIAVLHVESEAGAVHVPGEAVHVPEEDGALFRAVLAAGLASGAGGGLVLRSCPEPGADHIVRGWSLRDGLLHPLTAAEVFDAYCTDHRTGEPISPEQGVDYRAGFPLTHGEPS